MTHDSAHPVLGLDIGGTKLAAGVVDSDGHVAGFAHHVGSLLVPGVN